MLDFTGHAFRFSLGEVDLVDDWDQIEVVFHCEKSVCDSLGLNPLAGIHHQQGPLAGRQGSGNLIAEVHVAGGVDQVQLVGLTVVGLVIHGHSLALDGDAPFPLQLHLVKELGFHFLGPDSASNFQKAVGKCGLAMVNVRDDAEVSNVRRIHTFTMLSRPIWNM